MYINDTANIWTAFEANGLGALMDWIDSNPVTWPSNSSVTEGTSYKWCDHTPFDKALEYGRNGWSDGALRLASNLAGIALPAREEQGGVKYSVAGYRPNVARLCAGNPRHMVQAGRAPRKPRVIRLAIGIGGSAGCEAKHLASFGLGIASLVKWLEREGVRVELNAVSASEMGSKLQSYGWRVKEAQQPLDESALAFSIAHPAAFRRIGFGLRERSPERFYNYMYGVPHPVDERLKESLGLHPDTIVINGVMKDYDGLQKPIDALRLVARRIREAGGLGFEFDSKAFIASAGGA